MPPTSRLFVKFLANNRGPDVGIVDIVPSRHCALPQPKTENDTIDTSYKCNARGRGNVQVHMRIKISSVQPFMRNLHLPGMR